jgi:chromosomal replication initiation ATPase DnaA
VRKGQLRDREIEHDSVIKILEYAANKWRIPRTALTSKGRSRSVAKAREFVCYMFLNVMGMNLVDSGRILNISCQGVRAASERFLPDYDFDTEIKNILT